MIDLFKRVIIRSEIRPYCQIGISRIKGSDKRQQQFILYILIILIDIDGDHDLQ